MASKVYHSSVRVLLITGNSPRHIYLASRLASTITDFNCLVEKRTSFSPFGDITPLGLRKLSEKHFKDWDETEENFFCQPSSRKEIDNDWLIVDKEFLMGKEIVHWIISVQPDLVLSYGCSKLHSGILEIPGVIKLNVHGGLSPWYRGTITNFWPTYMLEPQFTGMTLHRTTHDIDGGDILLQTSVPILSEDGVNQVSCRATRTFIDIFLDLFYIQPERFISEPGKPQKTTGRIWTNRMWSPHHLRHIYETYDNRINEYCLQNNLLTRTPNLVNVFSAL